MTETPLVFGYIVEAHGRWWLAVSAVSIGQDNDAPIYCTAIDLACENFPAPVQLICVEGKEWRHMLSPGCQEERRQQLARKSASKISRPTLSLVPSDIKQENP